MTSTSSAAHAHCESQRELVERNDRIRKARALPRGQRPSLQALADEHQVSRERVRQIADGPRFDGRNGRLTLRRDDGSAVVLVSEGEGRYEARYRPPGSRYDERVGMVLGGRRNWIFEASKSAATLRSSTLKAVAEEVGVWAERRPGGKKAH